VSAEKGSFRETPIGSPEWSAAFVDAVKQGTSEAVEAHLRAGNPVYFTDDEGDICELSPDRKIRKLTREELEQFTSDTASS
jgi:hypothetical protein